MWNRLVARNKKPILWVVSGPSGSGKTTLCKKLLQKKRLDLVRSVSITTRALRKGEKQYRDYIFVSRDGFLKMARRNEFLEWQEIFGNFYGTPKRTIQQSLRRHKDVVLCIDVKGALAIKKKFFKQSVFIFIIPPSSHYLMRRIKARARESHTEIQKRLRRANIELSFAKQYDYIVVNDTVSEAVHELEAIITAKRLENVLHSARKNDR